MTQTVPQPQIHKRGRRLTSVFPHEIALSMLIPQYTTAFSSQAIPYLNFSIALIPANNSLKERKQTLRPKSIRP